MYFSQGSIWRSDKNVIQSFVYILFGYMIWVSAPPSSPASNVYTEKAAHA